MSQQCNVIIDNRNNPCSLVLKEITASEGTFNISIPIGTTINGNSTTPFSFNISNDSDFDTASATMVWSTGGTANYPSALITISFACELLATSSTATISVDGTTNDTNNIAAAQLAYGISYFSGSAGPGIQSTRDSINLYNLSANSPINLIYSIVANSFAITAPSTPFLPGITNVVMLMLENRSLDHLIGQVYTELDPPTNVYPENSSALFNGVGAKPTFTNTYTNTINGDPNTTTNYVAIASPVSSSLLDVPNPDPGEGFADTNVQLFYPGTTPPPDGVATMMGFLANYVQQGVTGSYPSPGQTMQFYTPEQLPVINTLAKTYAVSDAWFASVPSMTSPNRGFSLGGTSEGYVNNTLDGQPSTNPLDAVKFSMNTIFNALTNCGKGNDWTLYYQDDPAFHCLTEALFKQVDAAIKASPSNKKSFSDFLSDVKSGSLPAFSYLEPAWFSTGGLIPAANGNDYHPYANLCEGEQNLAQIYNALFASEENNPNWATTLFIVTFDEHGGIFDHVPPPCKNVVPPDDNTDWSGFTFDRLGLRVPTLLISPMINPGTVFRSPNDDIAFDHTSFIRTILGWQGIDISGGTMGLRAAIAPDFSGVLNSNANNYPNLTLNPPICPPSVGDVELNDIQKLLLPHLAKKLSGSAFGSKEHLELTAQLQSIKTVQKLIERVYQLKNQKG